MKGGALDRWVNKSGEGRWAHWDDKAITRGKVPVYVYPYS
jgi:hypothetical protein